MGRQKHWAFFLKKNGKKVKSYKRVKTTDFIRFQRFCNELTRVKSFQLTILPKNDFTNDLTRFCYLET
jgi:hypothetical protein